MVADNQNLHEAHLSISNGDHTGDPRVCRGIFRGFMGLLFGYLLTIVVHGQASVSIPFLQIGHMCTCVGRGGGEGQVKGDRSRVHLEAGQA